MGGSGDILSSRVPNWSTMNRYGSLLEAASLLTVHPEGRCTSGLDYDNWSTDWAAAAHGHIPKH